MLELCDLRLGGQVEGTGSEPAPKPGSCPDLVAEPTEHGIAEESPISASEIPALAEESPDSRVRRKAAGEGDDFDQLERDAKE